MKVLQIGLGGWGKNHARILKEMGILVAVCDTDRALESKYFDFYTDVDDVKEYYDTVFICTPASTHYEIAKKMLKAGKHVFVEKPLCLHSWQVKDLILSCSTKFTTGFIERFNPTIQSIKDPTNLTFYRGGCFPKHITDTNILFDTTIHDIDLANHLFNSLPIEMYANKEEDSAFVTLMYPGNRRAEIHSKWGVKRERYVIADDKKYDMLNDTDKLKLEIENFLRACEGKGPLEVTALDALLAIETIEELDREL